jgi:type I restriction-modification system DNA methylase subunit
MTSIQQRAELQRRIWQIANDVRGTVDGWDFKQYVLGTLFYRFISENFAAYIKGSDDSVDYAGLSDLFYGTTIIVTILVLSKHKTDTTTQFIDASGLFKKETNNNVLLDEHIKEIMAVFDSKANVDHFARSVSFEKVVANDYNLSVSSYVAAKDNREAVDITQLNAELKTTVVKIDKLRKDIDAIIEEIEGGEV